MTLWTFPRALVASYVAALFPFVLALVLQDQAAFGVFPISLLVWVALLFLGLLEFGKKALWMLLGAPVALYPAYVVFMVMRFYDQ